MFLTHSLWTVLSCQIPHVPLEDAAIEKMMPSLTTLLTLFVLLVAVVVGALLRRYYDY